MSKFSIKEIIEKCFNKNVELSTIVFNNSKQSHNMKVVAYDSETGDITLAQKKRQLKTNVKEIEKLVFPVRAGETFNNIICQRYFGETWDTIQGKLERKVLDNDPDCKISKLGSRGAPARPRLITTQYNGVPIDAIMTYGTITDILVDNFYRVGSWYSRTSAKWSSNLGGVDNRFYQ